MNFSSDLHATRDCLETRSAPVFCLRFESSRERLALPYSSLTWVALATDETVLELSFVTHRVVIKGRKLHEAHCAIAAGLALAICPGRKSIRTSSFRTARPQAAADENETIVISDIRIETVEAAP
jgi:hypothetical protein